MTVNKLLIICGPTATGKTDLALSLAKQFNGELLSADSRQVYKGLGILTGKDMPREFKFQNSAIKFRGRPLGFYGNGTRIWLTDIVPPSEPFSASLYAQVGRLVLSDIWRRNKLPIAVGGTGLYLQAITEDLSQIFIPPDQALRKRYQNASAADLQKALKNLDVSKWKQMNESDRANPRRLIRALEVSGWLTTHGKSRSDARQLDALWVGLIAPAMNLQNLISLRVQRRWTSGALDEVKRELSDELSHQLPVASSFGLSLLQEYSKGTKSEHDVVSQWAKSEYRYAKRQLTWFKKNLQIHWFDVTQDDWRKGVQALVMTWYTRGNDI